MDVTIMNNFVSAESRLGHEDELTADIDDMQQECLHTDISQLGMAIDEYVRLWERGDADADELATKMKTLKQQLAGVASDLGLIQWTHELHQKVYGNTAA